MGPRVWGPRKLNRRDRLRPRRCGDQGQHECGKRETLYLMTLLPCDPMTRPPRALTVWPDVEIESAVSAVN